MMKYYNKTIWLLRAMLIVLILLNMAMIYNFSEQDAHTSSQTSGRVSQTVAEITIKDFEQKPKAEQVKIVQKLQLPVRKLAHMAEFGMLGSLILLLLLTWKNHLFLRYISSLLITFLYACTDEWHQKMSAGRGSKISDVLIDLAGAVIACTLILTIALLIRHRRKERNSQMITVTHYTLPSSSSIPQLKLAVASDLHNMPYEQIINALHAEAPDLILIPGDLMDDEDLLDDSSPGYGFLRACSAIAPTYYSFGNHEIRCYHKGNPWRHPIPKNPPKAVYNKIQSTGAVLLYNESIAHGPLRICGLNSGINGSKNEPDLTVLNRFDREDGYRILLCHHPEYYHPYVRSTGIELTICGHAHGGQWRIFGRGVYAPGQGLFPKYTSGVLEDRCVISRGLGNHARIPRIFNSPELVMIHLDGSKKTRL